MGVPAECIPVDRILLHRNQLTHAVGTIPGRAGAGGIQCDKYKKSRTLRLGHEEIF